MTDEVTTSQRAVMKRAAQIANETIQREVLSQVGPIAASFQAGGWVNAWNPFRPDFGTTLGLKMDEISYVQLKTDEARARSQEIAEDAISQAMMDDPVWVGPMINDLVSGISSYVKFT